MNASSMRAKSGRSLMENSIPATQRCYACSMSAGCVFRNSAPSVGRTCRLVPTAASSPCWARAARHVRSSSRSGRGSRSLLSVQMPKMTHRFFSAAENGTFIRVRCFELSDQQPEGPASRRLSVPIGSDTPTRPTPLTEMLRSLLCSRRSGIRTSPQRGDICMQGRRIRLRGIWRRDEPPAGFISFSSFVHQSRSISNGLPRVCRNPFAPRHPIGRIPVRNRLQTRE